MSKRDEFIKAFNVPPVFQSYLDYLANSQEMDLVLALQNEKLTFQDICTIMGWSAKESEIILSKAVFKGIVLKEKKEYTETYTAGDFYGRLEPLAMYENWSDIPIKIREEVNELYLQDYIEKCRPVLEEIKNDSTAYHDIPNRDVLLLEEALEMVEGATEHLVLPCDCRPVMLKCNFPLNFCIRLDRGARLTKEKGHGRLITKDECKSIVLDADRFGLMHTGLKAWKENPNELFGLCSCCGCCCFPILSGIRLDMEKQYPRAHYIASHDPDNCELCENCAKRCHFRAFTFEESELSFNPEKCWGCGLCATGCPAIAIKMMPLSIS